MGWLRRTFRRAALQGRSRLRNEPPPLWFVAALTILLGAGVLALLMLVGLDGGTTMGVAGLVLGVAVPVIFDRRTQAVRSHTVLFLDYRDHLFGTSIYEGLVKALVNEPSLRVSYARPDRHDYPSEWQLQRLTAQDARSASAIVVIPPTLNKPQATDANAATRPTQSARLAVQLALLAAEGVFVVTVEEPLEQTPFAAERVPPPRHVQGDYALGGDMIGEWLAGQVRDGDSHDAGDRALLFLGPEGSPPARERSMHVLYALTRAGLAPRIRALELPDFDTGRAFAVDAVIEEARTVAPGARLYVLAGDDEIALAVNEALRELPAATSDAVRVIGYDGTKNASGEYDVLHARYVVATVDSMTPDWGRQVADFLRAEREATVDRLPTEVRLEPQFVTFDADRRVKQAPGTRLPRAEA